MTSGKQKRYTFEATKENSRKLREKLLLLIDDNSPIELNEKSKMLDLVDNSTLGIGTETVDFYMSDNKKITIPDFQQFLRCIIEYDKDVVDGSFFIQVLGSSYYDTVYPISEIWKLVLFNLNHFIPKALEASAKMSKEIISDGKSIRTVSTVKK